MIAPLTFACEPAGLDWEKLYQDYDRNLDQMIDQHEWQNLVHLKGQSVTWERQVFKTDLKRRKIFKALDQNHNGLLDQQEMSNIYQYFTNPCKGWRYRWGNKG